jgi:hypothetical protein
MFAGLKAKVNGLNYPVMPLNKPGSPKIGLFPYSANHNPRVSIWEEYVPLTLLPDTSQGGFVVASHCIVYGPNNYIETAWAYIDGNQPFTDKDWGWYDDITFWDIPSYTTVYGTTISGDGYLEVYLMDMDNGTSSLIVREDVGGTSGTYDASAFDSESGMMFFIKDGSNLYVNNMNDPAPSFMAGTLNGVATSATWSDGYYYVDDVTNDIRLVTFDTDWTKANESTLITIPSAIVVNDIAMSPEGDYLYMVGTQFGGAEELMSWQVGTDNFYSYATNVDDMQIAFGADGVLYGVAPDGTGGTDAYIIDTDNGIATEIIIGGGGWGGEEGQIIFTDMATGMPL